MKTLICALLLSLAGSPALAAGSDDAFAAGAAGVVELLRNGRPAGQPFIKPATQESGIFDPIYRSQAPLIKMIKKVRPSVVVLLAGGDETGKGAAFCTGFFVDTARILGRKTLIATNAHCVEALAVGAEVKVGLYDGSDARPKMTGGRILAFGSSDHAKDIAFVELLDRSLDRPGLPLWHKLDSGEQVVAIGHPRGLTYSVSMGVVSAQQRAQLDSHFILDSIQIDAAVNPGNSGGPLFNLWGSVVGINSMIHSQSGGFEGLAFALPAQYIERALRQYQRTGDLVPGSLWMALGPKKENGKLAVQKVVDNGPAAQAGLLAGDEVLSIDGIDLASQDPAAATLALIAHVKYLSPGEKTALKVRRGAEVLAITATVRKAIKPGEERPKWAPIPPKPQPKSK